MNPDLAAYDIILVNTSAGKDSQTLLRVICQKAKALGILDRVVAVHSDLGRVEWQGVKELAAEQAKHYGVRFEIVKKPGKDLLERVEERGMWPSPQQRWCTSDFKRGPILTVVTRLVNEMWFPGRVPVRVLNCMGLRAEESTARRKKPVFEYNAKASNGKRHVDTWLPIHKMTKIEVWKSIRESGVPYHHAYDCGMPRLSCCLCIFNTAKGLVLAGHHNRKLLDQYIAVQDKTGHKFRVDIDLHDIRDRVNAGEGEELTRQGVADWTM